MKLIETHNLYSTPWISLKEIKFELVAGKIKSWYFVQREIGQRAVCIIPIDRNTDELCLIRQFRPPIESYVWEFPAGLIDDDETENEAAVRELVEETGAIGKVVSISPQVCSSPGLTTETVSLVEVEIVSRGKPKHEEDEVIEVHWLKINGLFDFLKTASTKGDEIDAKLYMFALQQRL